MKSSAGSGTADTVNPRTALVIAATTAAFALIAFALIEALGVDLLVDPAGHMNASGAAALVGVGLLVTDVVAPVPSSLIMLAHGALFGVIPGALLSLLGRAGNAVVGVAIGRGAKHLAVRRDGRTDTRAAHLVARWGLAAVVVTRPIPIVAESALVTAGATGLSAPAIVVAAVIGSVPECVVYAVAGAAAASVRNATLLFVFGIALAAATWAVGTRAEAKRSRRA